MEERVSFRVAKAKKKDVPMRASFLVQEEDEEDVERPLPARKIEALSDTWRPGPKEDVSFVSERVDAKEEEGSYGLQEMVGRKKRMEEAEEGRLVPWERGKDIETWEHDLPEPCSLQDYEAMPVEKFGEALLRGMGWEKGKPVGRNPRGTVEAREYVRRPDRLGLGAQPKEILDKKKRKNRMDPSDRSNPHMVMIDEDGKVRHTKTLDEKLVEREKLGLYVGKRVAIMDGPHEGMSGKIVALEKRQSSMVARVKLELSGETIPVSSHLLGNISEVQAGRGLSGQEEEDSKVARATESILKQESHSGRSRRTSWLVPNIRVRIIDKRLAKGRYYLKKGHIVDVISPNSCDVVLDDGARHLSDVHQESLETVIPRVAGTPVRVLRGEHSRETAKLVSRDSSRGTVTVQLNTDYSLQTFRMDDVAEIQH